jgi:sirohydrochlorin cobaltochelatase
VALENGAMTMVDECVLLVSHGSRDEEGLRQALDFADQLRRRLGERVEVAFLEFNEPSVLEGLRRCVAGDVRHVTVMPLFLGAATHQKNDVPAAIARTREQYPGVTFTYGTPLGTHAGLVEAASTRALAALAGAGLASDNETAVLLVGRGSRDPDSNSDLYKLGRLLYESGRFGLVEACYIAMTSPDMAQGVARCVRLGARQVVVVPYMLFTGVLVKRMERIATELGDLHPAVRLVVAPPLSAEPRVLEVVEQRVTEARSGEARANCDACKYRVRMSGFEHEHALPQGSDHHHGLRGSA